MSYREVFKNEHFVIVDKEALVLSVPGRDKEDEREILGKILERDYGRQIYPVHRLDYEVSGLIMYAFTPDAHKVANAWFEKKEIQKTYQALTASPENSKHEFSLNEPLIWKCKLLRGKKRAYESPHGKVSETHACLVGAADGVLKWELNPVTGRSHQLRYELFRHGQPILNDSLYGANSELSKKFSGKGIALRAFRLDFSKAPRAHDFFLPVKIEIEGLSF